MQPLLDNILLWILGCQRRLLCALMSLLCHFQISIQRHNIIIYRGGLEDEESAFIFCLYIRVCVSMYKRREVPDCHILAGGARDDSASPPRPHTPSDRHTQTKEKPIYRHEHLVALQALW